MSLRKADSTVPQRISSLDSTCQVSNAVRSMPGTGKTWLEVGEAGPDRDCTTWDDNRSAFVLTGSAETVAPTYLPEGVFLDYKPLGDDHATTSFFFIAFDNRTGQPRASLYHLDLTPAGAIAGLQGDDLPGAVTPVFAQDGGYATLGIYGNSLRRLSWSAAGATLSPPIYTFQNPMSAFSWPPSPPSSATASTWPTA